MRRNVKFQLSLDDLEPRIYLSVVHVAAVVTKQVDDDPGDPGSGDPLPEPEPAPPPYPGPDPPLGWPPIPPSGPVGPGLSMDTLMPEKGKSAPIILGPVIKPISILA
jgi:hypothetical protein